MFRDMLKYHCKHTRQLRFRWFSIWTILAFCCLNYLGKSRQGVTIQRNFFFFFFAFSLWVCSFNEYPPKKSLRKRWGSKDTENGDVWQEGRKASKSWAWVCCLGIGDSRPRDPRKHCPTERQGSCCFSSMPVLHCFKSLRGCLFLGTSVLPCFCYICKTEKVLSEKREEAVILF